MLKYFKECFTVLNFVKFSNTKFNIITILYACVY